MVALLHHSDLIADADQQVPPLSTVQRDLSNDFVEALGVDLFTDGADTAVASALRGQVFVQVVREVRNVEGRRRGGGHIADPELPTILDFLRRQDLIQVVLTAVLLLDRC